MRVWIGAFLVALLCGLPAVADAPAPAEPSGKLVREQWSAKREAFGSPPLHFEANLGQVRQDILFYARRPDGVVGFTAEAAVFKLRDPRGKSETIRMELKGKNGTVGPKGLDKQPGRSSYFIGSDSKNWRSGVPHYGRLVYEEFRPGVDLVFYGSPNRLEYDLVVDPGAATHALTFRFSGADKIELDERGDLILQAGNARLVHRRPYVYQEISGEKRAIAGNYIVRDDGAVGFELEDYDIDSELVIDPVIEWSTLVGGRGDENDPSIVVDPAGNVYVASEVESIHFPTTEGAFDTTFNPLSDPEMDDIAVFKLDPSGSTLIFSTFVGGSSFETQNCTGKTIAVDSEGYVYVSGNSASSDFPTTKGAYDTSLNNDPGVVDAVAFKLSPDGSQLVYSTYIGGSSHDFYTCLAIDGAGDMYLAGGTESSSYPTTEGAYDRSHNGAEDLFFTKLRPAGAGQRDLLYSTFLGGTSHDAFVSIAVHEPDVISFVAETVSRSFPTTPGAFDESHNGDSDLVVGRLRTEGNRAADLSYSTFFGGSQEEERDGNGIGIAVGPEGDLFFTGDTESTQNEFVPFPVTPGAFQTIHGRIPNQSDAQDLLVARLRPAGKGAADLLYSTYIGGGMSDEDSAIAVDSNGYAYVVCETASDDYPTVNSIRPPHRNMNDGLEDVAVSVLTPDGSELIFSTYLGGTDDDDETEIFVLEQPAAKPGKAANAQPESGSIASNIAIYIGAEIDSIDFPLTEGAFDTSHNGETDLGILKIVNELPAPPPAFATVSGASFVPPVSAASIASGFSEVAMEGEFGAVKLPLPTVLGGRSVNIIDSQQTERTAQLFYVGRSGSGGTQVNFYVPEGTAEGEATVNLLVDDAIASSSTVTVAPVAPSLFTVTGGLAAAQFLIVAPDGSRTERFIYDNNVKPWPVDLGPEGQQVFLILFGTGVRNGSLATAAIGGQDVPVPAFVPHGTLIGLDQINLGPLPRSLAGAGTVDVTITVDGVESNSGKVAIQ